ncbi:hypothetical protein [Flavobacterium caeni]|nr:hypothetical protein [Flavobacterium caeni]
MKNIVTTILFLFSLNAISQNDVEESYYQSERAENDVNQLLSYPISNLSENESVSNLKKKLKSEINTVSDCDVFYKYSKILKLNETEIEILKNRIEEIAQGFCSLKKYTYFQYTGGYSPIFGVKDETINNKIVSTAMLGGGCVIEESDKKSREILALFNSKMENCVLNK